MRAREQTCQIYSLSLPEDVGYDNVIGACPISSFLAAVAKRAIGVEINNQVTSIHCTLFWVSFPCGDGSMDLLVLSMYGLSEDYIEDFCFQTSCLVFFPVWLLDLRLFYMFVCVDDVFDGMLVLFAFVFLGFFCKWWFGMCVLFNWSTYLLLGDGTGDLDFMFGSSSVYSFGHFFYQYFTCSCLCSLMFLMILLYSLFFSVIDVVV